MKTTITLFFSLFFMVSFAQVPNGGFENWTNMGTYSDPDNWATLNALTSIMGVATCEQGTPGSPGNYYMKLTSKDVPGLGVMPGIAFTGVLDVTTMEVKAGFPYTSRPGALNGKWQYMAYGADQGAVMAALTKWNSSTMTSDTIAMAAMPLPGMVHVWTNFTIPFVYFSSATPDTAIIAIMASGSDTPVANSYVWVDNLSFSGTAGIEDDPSAAKFVLSPNPATDKLAVNYNAEGTEQVIIKIYDINGRLVNEFMPGFSTRGENREVINLSGMSKGMYLLQMILGEKTTSSKFVIE